MIEVFKIVHNCYDADVVVKLRLNYNNRILTRGNEFYLENYTFHYNVRKYSFCPRIVNIWNSLPNYVVDVDCLNSFKARLDKFWMHQEVVWDYKAELTGTGNRSECVQFD